MDYVVPWHVVRATDRRILGNEAIKEISAVQIALATCCIIFTFQEDQAN
jgi:hypothetical protein